MTNWRQALRERLAPLGLRPEREAEIVDELAQHLDDELRELKAAGWSDADAEAAALAGLDAPGQLERRLAAIEGRPRLALPPPGAPARATWLRAVWQDLHHSVRSLSRAPAFALAVIATLALTIGPTTAILSIGNWMFWRPAPGVTEPDRLAVVWLGRWRDDGVSMSSLSYANLDTLQPAFRALSGLAGVQEGGGSVAIGSLPPAVTGVAAVTGNAFELLGLRLAAGRRIGAEDDRMPHGAHVAVISDHLARRAFGDVSRALGQRLVLNGQPLSIVGVATAFRGIDPLTAIDVWYPGATYAYVNHFAKPLTRNDAPILYYVARLAPGATFDAAQAELDVLVPALAEQQPDLNQKFATVRARLFPGLGPMALQRPTYKRLLRDLLIVSGVLLLLGCANASNLLIARGLRLRRDRTIRLALGASRTRLWQLQLAEGVVLAGAGGLAGLLVAVWLKQAVVALMVPGATVLPAVPLDTRVMAMTTAVALGCGFMAALLPGLVAARPANASSPARMEARTVTGARRTRTGLAIVQLALSVALVTNALLLVTSLRALHAVDLGFDPAGVSTHAFDPARHGYTRDRIAPYYDGLLARLVGAPGLDSVALSFRAPFGSGRTMGVQQPGAPAADRIETYANAVTPAYFDVLRIPTLLGRVFTAEEVSTRGDVAVISARLAARLFGESGAVGRSVELPGSAGTPGRALRIVGVVGDAQWRGITDERELFLYVPFGHGVIGLREATVLVRSALPDREVAARVQAAATELDPTLPVQFSRALHDAIAQSLSDQRVFAWMLSLLGGFGFALAAVGLYGLLAQGVGERTREFGLRLALGSTRGGVFALVLRHAAWIGAVGTAAGLALGYFGSRLIESQLYGVTRADPAIYALAAGSLAVVVLVAGLWPARTATRIQPMEALRMD